MSKIQPVQMIGIQRSGSNMLRVMLNQLNEVAAPHPPHILQRFTPLLKAYGGLSDKNNFSELVKDVCRLVELNPVKWEGISLNFEKIAEECPNHSLEEVFYAIYNNYAISMGANTWVCKSMANVDYAHQLEKTETPPLYLYLHRDGRDVACSFKKAIVGEKHIYHLAKKWKNNQKKCLAVKEKIEPGRFLQVSYEEILRDKEGQMQQICNFIGTEFNPEVFNFYKSEESKATASAGEMWGNVRKPVMKKNFNKYKEILTEEEVIIFEHVAGDVLEKLGYELSFPTRAKSLVISPNDVQQFDLENQKLKAEAKLKIDPEGQKLRKGQEALLNEIKSRI